MPQSDSSLGNRITYVNGDYVAARDAQISIFDRGFLFGDGIYEVTAVLGGKLVDNGPHMARLQRSLGEINIPLPLDIEAITAVQHELVRRNNLVEGLIYLQITRGCAGDRDFLSSPELRPTLVMFTQNKALINSASAAKGVRILSLDDQRWARRDIKTVCLLPQAMAKQIAKNAGCDEAWMIEDGFVTEGASSTAYIVTEDGTLVTRPNSHTTLPGCTRLSLLQLVAETDIKLEERAFTIDEAYAAREALMTSAGTFVSAITHIDDKPIGTGTPGPAFQRLREIYINHAINSAE